jgi:hypothetical protein
VSGSDEENDSAANIVGLCDVGFGLTRMRSEDCVRLCSATRIEERGLTKSRKKEGFEFSVS